MRMRLSTRLILGVVVIEAVMLTILVWNSVRLISSSHGELLESAAQNETRLISNTLAPGLLSNDIALLNDSLSLLRGHHNLVHLDVHDVDGNVIASLENSAHKHVETETHRNLLNTTKAGDTVKADKTYQDALSDGIFDVIKKVEVYGQQLGTIHAGYSVEAINEFTRQTRFQNTVIAAVALILSIFATILLGLILTRGLRKLEEGADVFGQGDLAYRIPISSHDEIGDVAQSFNQMADHLRKGQRELEKKNRQLVEQSEQIRLLMDSTEEAIYGADLNGLCTFVNPACVRVLGYSHQDELVGHSIHEMIHHTRPDGTDYPKEQCLVRLATQERKSGHSDEEVHWRKDGTSLPVEWWSHPIIKEDRIIGSVVTFIDITERRKVEQALMDAHNSLEQRVLERTEQLEKASNAKTEFLSRMSHELRTPLNAILGFGQLLEMGLQDNETHKQYINEVLHASEHLLELINETLDLSRIESGKMELNIEEVNLSEVLDECVALLNPLIVENELTFIREKNDAKDHILRVDRTRAKQVFINILSNAIKYNSDKGTITLQVTTPDNERVKISITDTGPGIPDAMQERIFEPFDRLGSSEAIEGTGVGLAITRSLVELMKGKVGLTSHVGSGSTFWVEFEGVVEDSPEKIVTT